MIEFSPASPIVLNRLVKHDGLTRPALQSDIGVSGPTVTRATAELIEAGLVAGNSSMAIGKGRPPETMQLAPEGLCSIGVSIQADGTVAALLDARGHCVARIGLAITRDSHYTDTVALIGDGVAGLARIAAERFAVLAGVGISFFGAADYAGGRIAEPSAFPAWHHKPLAGDIERYTGLPTAIENYSVALAGAVNWFDPDEPSDFYLVIADYGIGGVASIGGRPLLGQPRRPAGFGHIGSLAVGERPCHCGGFDCLAATSSVRALRDEAFAEGLVGDGGGDVGDIIAELDGSGVARAREMLSAAGARLAGAALDLCRGMGLPVCMLGGALFDRSELARSAARAVFAAPGHDCRARFLAELFASRCTDDLAAASIAYHHLSRTRRAYPLRAGRELDLIIARRAR